MADQRSILFVLGSARSGTTYVNYLLDEWFGFGMGPEGKFVARFYAKRASYGSLDSDASLDRLIDDIARCDMLEIMRAKWQEDMRVDVTPERIRSAVRERSFAGVIYAVFESVAAVQNKARVGNKWPEYWRQLPMLHKLFGQRARYLFVLRDGRDVALSTMRLKWGEKSSYSCAKSWVACIEAVEAFRRRFPAARVKTIRYEDVLEKPQTIWDELEEFLEIPDDNNRRARFLDELRQNPLRNNSGKWRRQMDMRDQRVYEAVAGAHLDSHGYEVVHGSPALSALEKTYYPAAELARKVVWNVRSRFAG